VANLNEVRVEVGLRFAGVSTDATALTLALRALGEEDAGGLGRFRRRRVGGGRNEDVVAALMEGVVGGPQLEGGGLDDFRNGEADATTEGIEFGAKPSHDTPY